MTSVCHSRAGTRHSGAGRKTRPQAEVSRNGHPAIQHCLFAFALFTIFTGMANAAELGRLFFTPQERDQLEIQGAVKSDAPVQRDTLTVNGMIQKIGGKRIYWINGEQQDAVASPEKAPASVRVAVPGKPQPVEVKVGQRVEMNPVQTAPAE